MGTGASRCPKPGLIYSAQIGFSQIGFWKSERESICRIRAPFRRSCPLREVKDLFLLCVYCFFFILFFLIKKVKLKTGCKVSCNNEIFNVIIIFNNIIFIVS